MDRVRTWREEARQAAESRAVIVANSSWTLAPWADALYAMDRDWWSRYHADVLCDFRGARYSNNPVKWATRLEKFHHYGNSGAACISLAIAGGARRVILLGYDCSVGPEKQRHWHADYPAGMGNAGMIHKWPEKFNALANDYRTCARIINASRKTALTCFERTDLANALAD